MSAPVFIASSSTSYSTSITPKTTLVTTQPGDIVIVYCGTENGGFGSMGTPTGNGIVFTLQQSIHISASWSDAYVWTGVDATGGTSWTLSTSFAGGINWGFSCLVFRGSSGIGVSSQNNVATSAPSLGLTTTGDNSAVIVFNADWNAQNGAGRIWRTVNGITPTAGNSLERDFTFVNTSYTVYGAYYSDVGAAGAITVGLTGPAGQTYSIVAVEVKGVTIPVITAWLVA